MGKRTWASVAVALASVVLMTWPSTVTIGDAATTSSSSSSSSSSTSTAVKKPQHLEWRPVPTAGTTPDRSFVATAVAVPSGLPVTIGIDPPAGTCALADGSTSPAAVRFTDPRQTCKLRASQAGDATWQAAADITADVTVSTVQTRPQVIVPQAPSSVFEDEQFTASAAASSHLPVDVRAEGNCIGAGTSEVLAGIDAGGIVPLAATIAGTCRVHFNQAGNADWLPATEVVVEVQVLRAEYVPLRPVRILETRDQRHVPPYDQIGYRGDEPAAATVVRAHVFGPASVAKTPAGTDLVPADARAVVLNLTAVDGGKAGFVTAWNCSGDHPNASNVNPRTRTDGLNETPNLVIVAPGAAGDVCLFVSQAVHLVVDLNGYFSARSSYTSVVPTRALDTRPDQPAQIGYTGPKPEAGQVVRVRPKDVLTVPPSDVIAVFANVTADRVEGAGTLTIWNCGVAEPATPTIGLIDQSTIPTSVAADVSAEGEICLRASVRTDLVVDLEGFFQARSGYHPLVQANVVDATLDTGKQREFPIAGAAGVPTENVSAVVFNVRASGTGIPGYVTIWDCSGTRPTASNVNVSPTGSTTTNLALAKLSPSGSICVYAQERSALVMTVVGYFGPLET